MNQVVFADPTNRDARELCADALEQLGYQAESATWRNAYLFGARELRMGPLQLNPRTILSPDLVRAITTETFFDFMAVRLNADRAAGHRFVIDWRFSDTGQSLVLNLEHSTLTHTPGPATDSTLVVTTTRPVLDSLMVRQSTVAQSIENGGLKVGGDAAVLELLFAMLDDFPLMFDILTPAPYPR